MLNENIAFSPPLFSQLRRALDNYCPPIENTKKGQIVILGWIAFDRQTFFIDTDSEDSCLFIVPFRSLESYLISWTLNPAQFDDG